MKKKWKEEEIPTFEIYISEDDLSGIRLLSLVDDPAIQMKGLAFSKEEALKSFDFKANRDQQIIMGPAMIPNKKILRKDDDGNKYFVVFTKDTIRQMVSKFNSSGTNKRINIDHTSQMVDAYIMENWIVEDEYYDKSRKYGFEVPVGTWMVSVKVNDEKFWKEKVKEGGRYGFSIEGVMGQKPVNYSLRAITLEDYIDNLTEGEIREIFNEVIDEEIWNFFKQRGTDIEEDSMTFADELEDFLPSQRVYVYALKPGVEGPFIKGNSRPFCRHMRDINRYWTEADINELSAKLGYDFWEYFGSYNCRHTLKPVILTKNTNPATQGDITTGVAKQAEAGLLGFSDMKFAKVSYDYHDTLNTDKGLEMAKKDIAAGNEVYIISAASNKEDLLAGAKEAGIPESRVYAVGSNEAKVKKIKDLGITKHVDNNADVIKELGSVGQKFQEFKSYADYGEGVKSNAKKVLDWTEENGWGSCGTPVGKQRANQLAKGEPISLDTIKRMYSYLSRHEVDLESSKSYNDGCGKLMYDSWGGKAALGWSRNKLRELGELKENEALEFKIEPKADETEREFLSRCIPFEINNGKEQDQAIAICYSIWDQKS